MVLEYGASSSSLTIMKGGAALDVGVGTRSGFDGVAGFCMMAQLLVNQRFILIANSTETSRGNGCEARRGKKKTRDVASQAKRGKKKSTRNEEFLPNRYKKKKKKTRAVNQKAKRSSHTVKLVVAESFLRRARKQVTKQCRE